MQGPLYIKVSLLLFSCLNLDFKGRSSHTNIRIIVLLIYVNLIKSQPFTYASFLLFLFSSAMTLSDKKGNVEATLGVFEKYI